jgi:uncharacterized protein (TIGR02145 family)
MKKITPRTFQSFRLFALFFILLAGCDDDPIQLPQVSTSDVSAIKSGVATAGGNVTHSGGGEVTMRGVCWSINQNPTLNDSKTENGQGEGIFISTMSNLTPSTTYFVRAYASNSAGTAYGNEVSFSTAPLTVVPVITTSPITSITAFSALSGGIINDAGGAPIFSLGVCWSVNQNPTTNNSKTEDVQMGAGFTSAIAGLSPNTTYFVRAYAQNNAGTGYGEELTFKTKETTEVGITDIDGNWYTTITIGTQVWLGSNLRTTTYNDGTPIPNVTGGGDWAALSSGAYAYYNNDISNANTYGALYNWYAVNTGMLCPQGWLVPTDEQWIILTDFVGVAAGGKLKAKNGWYSFGGTNGNGTDNYGFSAHAGGYRDPITGGGFNDRTGEGWWWTSTESSSDAWLRFMSWQSSGVIRITRDKRYGKSVRCFKE